MPTFEHEVIVQIAQEHPETLRALLEPLLREGAWKPGAPVASPTINLSQLVPTQFLADAILVVGDPVEFALIIEVQRKVDTRKLRSWPLYVHAVHAKLGCPVELVVIATTSRVASWAEKPIRTMLASSFKSIVIGPNQVPDHFGASTPDSSAPDPHRIAGALATPELVVLSAIMHGRGPQSEHIGRVAIDTLKDATGDPAADRATETESSSLAGRLMTVYLDFVLSRLTPAIRDMLENEMNVQNYSYQTNFAKKYIGQGIEQGIELGLQRALISLLMARGLVVTESQRQRIALCTDVKTLDRWVVVAVSATSVEDVFA